MIKGLPMLIVAQTVVTIGLLAFAWAAPRVPDDVRTLIIGAAIAHWLSETPKLGRMVTDGSSDYVGAPPPAIPPPAASPQNPSTTGG